MSNFGSKQCLVHRKQGGCIDSRQTEEGHVTRRYRCFVKGCKERWTTVEYRIPETGGKYLTSSSFVRQMKKKGADEAKAAAREFFKDVLGIDGDLESK